MTFTLINADCVEAMQAMAENSVDAIVTDPPYNLSFMGKTWDMAHDHEAWATEALRILKPGGHLLAFGGTRTYHRLACAIEDAGFEIRDCLAWMYGSGFPKSLNVSKAIDKAAGAEREVVGSGQYAARANGSPRASTPGGEYPSGRVPMVEDTRNVTAPATPEAQRWNGWGTALKPAFEPIVLARKPLSERNVAANVQRWGTGALNIDGCRIDTGGVAPYEARPRGPHSDLINQLDGQGTTSDGNALGRWPANVTLDETAAAMLDEQTGEVGGNSGGAFHHQRRTLNAANDGSLAQTNEGFGYQDQGGASRFFHVVPKEDNELCLLAPLRPDCQGWRRSTAAPAVVGSTPSSPQRNGTAPELAPTLDGSSNGHPAVSAAPLCDSCVTAIAQSVAAISQGNDPALHLGLGSTPEPKRQTLIRSLAILAEAQGNTAITTTTPSLSLWCGYVRSAIADITSRESAEASTASGPTRFRYQAKADREERNRGLGHMAQVEGGVRYTTMAGDGRAEPEIKPVIRANTHPTVKPVELMRWLCRMVTPKGGTVLDPFTGSGSTGVAAMREGFEFIGIEQSAEYVEIARSRIYGDAPMFNVEVGGGPTE